MASELIAIVGKAAYVNEEASGMAAGGLEVVGDGEGGVSGPWWFPDLSRMLQF